MVVYSKVIKFVAAVVALVYTSSSQHFTHVSHWVTIRLKVSGQSFLRVWGISSMNGFVDFLLVSGPLAPNSDQCAPRWAQKVSLKTFKFWHLIKRLSKVCFNVKPLSPERWFYFFFYWLRDTALREIVLLTLLKPYIIFLRGCFLLFINTIVITISFLIVLIDIIIIVLLILNLNIVYELVSCVWELSFLTDFVFVSVSCISWQISKWEIWKNTAGKSACEPVSCVWESQPWLPIVITNTSFLIILIDIIIIVLLNIVCERVSCSCVWESQPWLPGHQRPSEPALLQQPKSSTQKMSTIQCSYLPIKINAQNF